MIDKLLMIIVYKRRYYSYSWREDNISTGEDYKMKKIIVIGTGILGATAAYKLAKSGADVTVIDRNEHGQATGAAAGVICPWLTLRRNKAWYILAKKGARLYPTLINELEEDGEKKTGYAQTGAISIHRDEQKLFVTEQRALQRLHDAPEMGTITRLNPSETKKHFPLVGDHFHAIYVSGGAKVDGRLIRDALLRGAKKYGAHFITGEAKLIQGGANVVGVKIDDSSDMMKADVVLATTGAWTKKLLAPLEITFKGNAQKGQIIHVHVPNTDPTHWPVLMPPNNLSIVPFNDRIIVGSTHEWKADFDPSITAGGIHEILSKALAVAPDLSNGKIIETRVGFRPYTPESLPIIGSIPQVKGLLLANGLGASGLTTGPYLGNELAKLALNKPIDIDLALYDVRHAISN